MIPMEWRSYNASVTLFIHFVSHAFHWTWKNAYSRRIFAILYMKDIMESLMESRDDLEDGTIIDVSAVAESFDGNEILNQLFFGRSILLLSETKLVTANWNFEREK